MRFTHCAALSACLCSPFSAPHAALVTYDFSVVATDGPLAGQASSGFFTFDSSSIPSLLPGNNLGVGVFTDLEFIWNGITYDETTANTGGLVFDAAGNLSDAVFGSRCISGFCFAGARGEDWFIRLANNSFVYSLPPQTPGAFGSASFALRDATVPEPSTLALAAIAVAALTARYRRVTRPHDA